MIDFRLLQTAVYEEVSRLAAPERCFLHLAREEDAVWVTDLPRVGKHSFSMSVFEILDGIRTVSDSGGLLRLDLSAEAWEALAAEASGLLPSFPSLENLQDLYALCRLYAAHPSNGPEDFTAARNVLKLCLSSEAELLRSVPSLWRAAAEALRKGAPLGRGAGVLLADYLNQKSPSDSV